MNISKKANVERYSVQLIPQPPSVGILTAKLPDARM